MKRIAWLLSIALILLQGIDKEATAQRASGDKVTYKYFQYPLTKTPEDSRTYSVQVDIPYADAYREEMANYEKEEARAQKEYEEDRKQADADYEAAMDAYNSQGAGAKILTGMLVDGNGKPEKREVEKRYVRSPKERSDIPTESEIINAVQWDGFTRQEQGHYTLKITMPEYTIIKKDEPTGERWSRTVEINPPINYTVQDKNEQVVHRGSVQYTFTEGAVGIASRQTPKFKTDRMTKEAFDEFVNGPSYDAWLDSKKTEARGVGMELLNEDLNGQLGYGWVERTSPIYTGKGRKHDYSSLDEAALLAQQGLEELAISESTAEEKLKQAMAAWNKELETQDLDDKKARVNNKVAASLYLNLALVNIILGELDKADALLHTVQSDDNFKGGDQREADDLRDFLNKRRRRA